MLLGSLCFEKISASEKGYLRTADISYGLALQ